MFDIKPLFPFVLQNSTINHKYIPKSTKHDNRKSVCDMPLLTY